MAQGRVLFAQQAKLAQLRSTAQVTWSMNRSGDVWDDSAMEGFFSSLKI